MIKLWYDFYIVNEGLLWLSYVIVAVVQGFIWVMV
jgi:hypothetical protein